MRHLGSKLSFRVRVPVQALKYRLLRMMQSIGSRRKENLCTKNLCMKKALNVTYRPVGKATNYRYRGNGNSK